MTVLRKLRTATRSAHAQLERDVPVLETLRQPLRRGAVLRAYYGLYASMEEVLAPWLRSVRDLDFEGRRKAGTLLADLRTLGEGPPLPVPLARSPRPPVPSRASAFGLAYVLEGATLGARIIGRKLAAEDPSFYRLRFFEGYGAATAARWTQFCEILERECVDGSADAQQAAIEGFAYAGCILRLGCSRIGPDNGPGQLDWR